MLGNINNSKLRTVPSMVMVESMFFDPHNYNSRCAAKQHSRWQLLQITYTSTKPPFTARNFSLTRHAKRYNPTSWIAHSPNLSNRTFLSPFGHSPWEQLRRFVPTKFLYIFWATAALFLNYFKYLSFGRRAAFEIKILFIPYSHKGNESLPGADQTVNLGWEPHHLSTTS